MDCRTDNTCDLLLPVLGPQHDLVEHRSALPHREVGAAIAGVQASDPDTVDMLALEFVVLAAARVSEVRGSVWSEMDQDSGVWTIPTFRMKTAQEPRVPRCGRTLEILEPIRMLDAVESGIVFVNEPDRALDAKRLGQFF